MLNYLGPIYATGAGSNDGDYSNKEFDKLLAKASGAQDDEERYKLLAEAQAILLKDLPAIPLWYQNARGCCSRWCQERRVQLAEQAGLLEHHQVDIRFHWLTWGEAPSPRRLGAPCVQLSGTALVTPSEAQLLVWWYIGDELLQTIPVFLGATLLIYAHGVPAPG